MKTWIRIATLVMFALPAELVSLKVILPGCMTFDIVIVALPAVLELLNVREVSTRSRCELAAVLVLLNVIAAKLEMSDMKVAEPADAESLNIVVAPTVL